MYNYCSILKYLCDISPDSWYSYTVRQNFHQQKEYVALNLMKYVDD